MEAVNDEQVWWTCTPRDFEGNERFFARDSGLICMGLRAMGMSSRAVVTGEPRHDDLPELLRVDQARIHSPDWWRNTGATGVILYAWGRPEYTPLVSAIHEAGLDLILSQDSGGLASPLCGLCPWLKERWWASGRAGLLKVPLFLCRVAKALTYGLYTLDYRRKQQFLMGTWITPVTPGATARYRRLCRIYRGRSLAAKVVLLPHPITEDCLWRSEEGIQKEDRMVAIGRWKDEAQKRTKLMVASISLILKRRHSVKITIIGEPSRVLEKWLESLPCSMRERVELIPFAVHEEIVAILKRSRVFFCPSAFESFSIAAGEAVCCGTTVVGERSASLPGLRWFTHDGGGTLVEEASPCAMAAGVLRELDAWDAGERNPEELSRRWGERIHAQAVGSRIVDLGRRARNSRFASSAAPF